MIGSPRLTTEKLALRQMVMSDFPALIKYANNEKIAKNIFNINFPYTQADAVSRYETVLRGIADQNRFIFAITQLERNELIGEIGLNIAQEHSRAEVGYWIAEDYWGQGFATQALGAILNFGFKTLQLNKIYATHFNDNPSSARILIKNGMIKEAEMLEHYKINGEFKGISQYRLTVSEFDNLHSS